MRLKMLSLLVVLFATISCVNQNQAGVEVTDPNGFEKKMAETRITSYNVCYTKLLRKAKKEKAKAKKKKNKKNKSKKKK